MAIDSWHNTRVKEWQAEYERWLARPRFTPEDRIRSARAADELLWAAARVIAAQS